MLPYERQLEVKAEQVGDALRRIGRLEGFEQEPIVPAVEQWRYRNKLEYSFGTAADGTLVCGFHAPGRFDQIVPLDDCLLASERGNAPREQVLDWAREQGLGAWDRRTQQGFLRNLVVREGRRTGELQVRLVTAPGRARHATALAAAVDATGLFWTQMTAGGESTHGRRHAAARGRRAAARAARRARVPDLARRLLPDQHRDGRAPLRHRRRARRPARAPSASSTSTAASARSRLSLAARARDVVGVEIVEPAVADAIDNARRNEITNASFFAGDIRLAMRELVEQEGKPGRAASSTRRAPGLSQKIVRRIVEAGPRGSSTSPATRRRSRRTPRS